MTEDDASALVSPAGKRAETAEGTSGDEAISSGLQPFIGAPTQGQVIYAGAGAIARGVDYSSGTGIPSYPVATATYKLKETGRINGDAIFERFKYISVSNGVLVDNFNNPTYTYFRDGCNFRNSNDASTLICRTETSASAQVFSVDARIVTVPTDQVVLSGSSTVTFYLLAQNQPAPPTPLSVSVSGPSSLTWKQQGTYTASVSGGSGTVGYHWYTRTPGETYWTDTTNLNSTHLITMVYTGGIELRADVTRGGQTASTTYSVGYGVDTCGNLCTEATGGMPTLSMDNY